MAALPDRLTHQGAPAAIRQLTAALHSQASGAAGPLVIDASALHHFDSSALAVLLECRRLADAKSIAVQIVDAPAKLAQLARLYGLDDVLLLNDQAAEPNHAVQDRTL